MLTFALGQPSTTPPAMTITAPVLPDAVALKCSYDGVAQAFKCSAYRWYTNPAIYITAGASFLFGYLLAGWHPLKKSISEVRALVR